MLRRDPASPHSENNKEVPENEWEAVWKLCSKISHPYIKLGFV